MKRKEGELKTVGIKKGKIKWDYTVNLNRRCDGVIKKFRDDKREINRVLVVGVCRGVKKTYVITKEKKCRRLPSQ